jgi:MFS family permease
VLTYLDRVCISRVQEHIQADLLISDIQMGVVFSAFLLGYTLFEVPGGWMGERWGSRRVLTCFVLWWSLFTALTGAVALFSYDSGKSISLGRLAVPLLLNSFVLLVLIRFLFGCGEAGAFPNLARAVGNWFPYRERAVAQGAIWMSARLGGAIAAVVIGRLTVAFGWRRAFWMLGVFGVVWCLLFAWWFRDRPEDKPGCNEAERDLIRSGVGSFKADEAATVHGPTPWRILLFRPSLWALYLTSFCVSFGWYFYPTYQPRFLKEVHKISFEDSEVLTGLPFLCGAIGCILGGRLSDRLVSRTGNRRWGRSLLGVFGFAGAGLCVLLTGFVHQPWQAVALLCLAFFINDLAIPVIWAVSADIGGRYTGTLSGLMNTAGGIGGLITPVLIPVLNSLPGDAPTRWRIVFLVLSTAWFIGSIAWLFIDASTPLVPGEEDAGTATH